MEVELILKGKPGDMFAGRSIKRNCPTCDSKNGDQLWMEARKTSDDEVHGEGIAWCPCGTIFYYSTTNKYEEFLKQRIDLGRIDKVLHIGGSKSPSE